MRPEEKEELDKLEIPTDFVERKRRECKKDHSKDKQRIDSLERQRKNSHKRKLQELEEDDDDDDEYSHLWK